MLRYVTHHWTESCILFGGSELTPGDLELSLQSYHAFFDDPTYYSDLDVSNVKLDELADNSNESEGEIEVLPPPSTARQVEGVPNQHTLRAAYLRNLHGAPHKVPSGKTRKFYAVHRGWKPSIYGTWTAASFQLPGFPGAYGEGYKTLEEARADYNYCKSNGTAGIGPVEMNINPADFPYGRIAQAFQDAIWLDPEIEPKSPTEVPEDMSPVAEPSISQLNCRSKKRPKAQGKGVDFVTSMNEPTSAPSHNPPPVPSEPLKHQGNPSDVITTELLSTHTPLTPPSKVNKHAPSGQFNGMSQMPLPTPSSSAKMPVPNTPPPLSSSEWEVLEMPGMFSRPTERSSARLLSPGAFPKPTAADKRQKPANKTVSSSQHLGSKQGSSNQRHRVATSGLVDDAISQLSSLQVDNDFMLSYQQAPPNSDIATLGRHKPGDQVFVVFRGCRTGVFYRLDAVSRAIGDPKNPNIYVEIAGSTSEAWRMYGEAEMKGERAYKQKPEEEGEEEDNGDGDVARSHPGGKKTKKAQYATGLAQGYKKDGLVHPLTGRRPKNTAASAHTDTEEPGVMLPDGILDDDDDVETHNFQIASVVKIDHIQIVDNQVMLPSSRCCGKGQAAKRKRPVHQNLPNRTVSMYLNIVCPLLYDHISSMRAWQPITNNAIFGIWNLVMKKNKPGVVIDKEKRDSKKAKTLLSVAHCNISTNYIHGLAVAGIAALEAEWQECKLKSKTEKAQFVKTMLGGTEEEHLSCHQKVMPFLFASAYNTSYNGQNKGPLLGNLVPCTLATHFCLVDTLPKKAFTLNSKPAGALIMSIQAAHRALIYAQGRKIKIPHSKVDPAAPFSAANWNNYTKVDDNGSLQSYTHASLFHKHVETLTEHHWDDIMKGAHKYANEDSPPPASTVNEKILMDMGSENDDELMDPDYNQPNHASPEPIPTFGVPGFSSYEQALQQDLEQHRDSDEEIRGKQYNGSMMEFDMDMGVDTEHDAHGGGEYWSDRSMSSSSSDLESSLGSDLDSDNLDGPKNDEIEYMRLNTRTWMALETTRTVTWMRSNPSLTVFAFVLLVLCFLF
ncbi:hypothetical protein NP233_g8539 [Leucocoprinus birnbaumii]|uniref:Ribonuclease H1 N-terminal domain-containing protein n=1 Tax=Leucocoprinus birnbaumii TaxID=56174 RepID=A0AAD5VM48_9AGAR|nr:hypothetical protein NP233_g8539 [Leucocoprinus birnbaumii]